MTDQAATVRRVELEDDRPPYVRCQIAVEVEVDGQWYPGLALAYWGDKVTARWTVAVGMTHMGTVPAERVRRHDAGKVGPSSSVVETGTG